MSFTDHRRTAMANFHNDTDLDTDLDEAARQLNLSLHAPNNSLPDAANQLQAQVISSEGSFLPLGALENPMSIAGFWEPVSSTPCIADTEFAGPMPDYGLLYDEVSFYPNIPDGSQEILPSYDTPDIQQSASAQAAQKRAPKVPTISFQSWKPYEKRIRELYVHERKSIEELQEIINAESGFTAK